jgi:hypothetical protein
MATMYEVNAVASGTGLGCCSCGVQGGCRCGYSLGVHW